MDDEWLVDHVDRELGELGQEPDGRGPDDRAEPKLCSLVG